MIDLWPTAGNLSRPELCRKSGNLRQSENIIPYWHFKQGRKIKIQRALSANRHQIAGLAYCTQNC